MVLRVGRIESPLNVGTSRFEEGDQRNETQLCAQPVLSRDIVLCRLWRWRRRNDYAAHPILVRHVGEGLLHLGGPADQSDEPVLGDCRRNGQLQFRSYMVRSCGDDLNFRAIYGACESAHFWVRHHYCDLYAGRHKIRNNDNHNQCDAYAPADNYRRFARMQSRVDHKYSDFFLHAYSERDRCIHKHGELYS